MIGRWSGGWGNMELQGLLSRRGAGFVSVQVCLFVVDALGLVGWM